MDAPNILFQTLLLLFLPSLLLYGEKRLFILKKLSPVFFCYVLGIIWGNLPFFRPNEDVLDFSLQICVPLAIPLLLFPTDIPAWLKLAAKALISFGLWIVTLAMSGLAGAIIFQNQLEETHKLTGMVMGVYTGGTPNLAAIHLALGVEEATFIEMNFTDMLLSGIYLMLLLTVMQKLFQKWLPTFQENEANIETEREKDPGFVFPNWKSVGIVVIVGLTIIGISVGISMLITGKIDELIVIIGVSIFGLLAATHSFVRNQSESYNTGQYLMMIFCIAVGAKVNLTTFFQDTSAVIGLMTFIFTGALLLHVLFAKIFRIDADTTLITSTAGIFGPPFIGPVANAMNNKSIIPTGMTLGVMGLAFGNLLGILLSWLIQYSLMP